MTKGVWKKDPRGVDFVSFTMPEEPTGKTMSFPFEYKEDLMKVTITSTNKILGVIVLMNPNEKN